MNRQTSWVVGSAWSAVRNWPVWSLSRHVLTLLISVELIAVVVTVATATRVSVDRADWFVFGVLAAGSVVHMEAVRRTEREREALRGGAPYVDLKSLWTFAAVLLLPLPLAVALVVLTYAHMRWRVTRLPVYRCVYSSATVVLATQVAAAILYSCLPSGQYPGLPGSWTGVLVIILTGLTRLFVNYVLVALIIILSSPDSGLKTLRDGFADIIVDCAGVSLGAVTALAIMHDPWYVLLVLPPLLVLHRSLLLHRYEVAARTDEKTGLVNAMHWSEVARRELSRSHRDSGSVGVLMMDLDHFKRVNDTYGHLAGDAVLKAVAAAMRKDSRDYDLAGRFGGEEFVLLLPGISADDLLLRAERLRDRIASLSVPASNNNGERIAIKGLTASIGVATFPTNGQHLDELLLAADTALYKAKGSGRNRTCFAHAAVPAPRTSD